TCTVASPQFYVALDATAANADHTRAGITCQVPVISPAPSGRVPSLSCSSPPAGPARGRAFTPASPWTGFVEVAQPGGPTVTQTFPLANVEAGDGVFVSVSLDPSGSSVHTLL